MITVVAIFLLMAFKSYPEQCSCGNICNRLEKSGECRVCFKFNKVFLGTDGAASSWVGQILLFRVEASIPYSAPLKYVSITVAILANG